MSDMEAVLIDQRDRIRAAVQEVSDRAGGGDIVRIGIWRMAVAECVRAIDDA